MREEVLLLPLPTERSNCLRKDEALFNTSRKCPASQVIYVKKSSHVASMRRDWKLQEEVHAPEFVSEEDTERQILRGEDHFAAPSYGLEKHDRRIGEVFSKQMMGSSASLSLHPTQEEPWQGAPQFQWGSRKRNRCTRGPNDQPKPCNLIEEPKTVRVPAINDPSAVALEENSHSKNAIARRRERPYSLSALAADHAKVEEEDRKRREKCLRSGDFLEEKRGVCVKRGSLQASQQAHQQQEHLPITRSSLGKIVESPDKYLAANADGLKASQAGKALALPKFVLPLSRNEIEEDFLMFKSSKLSKRPRRRPRVAEKAVLYCTPGTWLFDVSYARYNVKEKRCVKEKLRGLKAMQSLESDSE